jgi:hypothetical protein
VHFVKLLRWNKTAAWLEYFVHGQNQKSYQNSKLFSVFLTHASQNVRRMNHSQDPLLDKIFF